MSFTVGVSVLVLASIQVVEAGCGKRERNNGKNEDDDDCWYQLWYFWLIVGLFVIGAAVIVFFYCQQYAKNTRIERRVRRCRHQMVLPPAPPSYEEPGHQPPPYHIALSESTAANDAYDATPSLSFRRPSNRNTQHEATTNANQVGLDGRPISVPPPYSLIDQRNGDNNDYYSNNSNNTGENSFVQLSVSNLPGYSNNSINCANSCYSNTNNSSNNSNRNNNNNNNVPFYQYSSNRDNRAPAENVFQTQNSSDAHIERHQDLVSIPLDCQLQTHQYCELPLPPYESRPQSAIQGPRLPSGGTGSVIESSLTVRIATLARHQVVEVNSCTTNTNPAASVGGNSRVHDVNAQNSVNSETVDTDTSATSQRRRVSVPQIRSTITTTRTRRSLQNGRGVSSSYPPPNSTTSPRRSSHHGTAASQNSNNSRLGRNVHNGNIKQTASNIKTNQAQQTSTTSSTIRSSNRDGSTSNETIQSSSESQSQSQGQSLASSSSGGIQWSRRLSEQGQ